MTRIQGRPFRVILLAATISTLLACSSSPSGKDNVFTLAEKGDAQAQHRLGFMYYKGKGVPQDHAEAAKRFRKAAERGLVESQYNLGFMYSAGHGVPQDYVQSYFWASLAASQSIDEAYTQTTEVRDEAAKKMNPDKFIEALRMTAEWEKSHPRRFLPPHPHAPYRLI